MKPEHAERAKICNECEHLNKLISQCRKCGCWMPAKTRLNWAECPIGKWGKIIPTKEVS
jgi:hypothetical protein